MLEKELEKKFCERIKAVGGLALKFTSPGRAGVPDRAVLFNGKVYFAEIKRNGEKLRPLQEATRKQFQNFGFDVAVIAGEEDIEIFVEKLKGGDAVA